MKQSQSERFFPVDFFLFCLRVYSNTNLEAHSFEVVPLPSFLSPIVSVVRLCRKKQNCFFFFFFFFSNWVPA